MKTCQNYSSDYFADIALLTVPYRGPYHIETGTLTCSTCRWFGFYMIGTSVMKELREDVTKLFDQHNKPPTTICRGAEIKLDKINLLEVVLPLL